ncbi:cytochrome P450 [Ceratobasidium sp. AG-I]|nr:cytochrome P450 [Ceratobasidium sp. AG-I]
MMTFERSYGDTYTEWIESFGTTYKIKGALFHSDILVTADLGAIAQILGKETYAYVKSPATRPLVERLAGRSLVWAEGHTHKRQRHQLAPFFSTQATHNMFEVINACAQTGSERLAAYINATVDTKHEATVDIMDWTWRVTLDIIGRVGFNHDFGCGESENAKAFQHTWKTHVDTTLQKAGFIGFVAVRAFPFITKLPLKTLKDQEEVKRIIHSIGGSMLECDANGSKDDNLLSTLARLAATDGSGISNQELLDHVATIIIAGNETTAGSLGFAFHELAQNSANSGFAPGCSRALQSRATCSPHEPTYEDYVDKMPWLDAVTKETFRLHPIGAHLERTALKDDTVRLQTPLKDDKGHEVTHISIKAGQLVRIPTFSMGRLKSVWGEDASEFRPVRWLDPSRLPSSSSTPPGWNGLLAFSAGPRMCIGYRLAVLEFKVILATYARRFEFHDTGATVHTKFMATLQPYIWETGKT